MSLGASTARGATYLILQLVIQRLFTFTLNNLLVRWSTPVSIGFSQTEMELLLTTVLFLSRESVRIVSARASGSDTALQSPVRRAQIVNFAWIPVIFGVVISVIVGAVYLQRPLATEIENGKVTIVMYCIAAVIEAVAEPYFIITQCSMQYGTRATIEGIGTALKTVTTFVLVAFAGYGVEAFGIAQLLFSLSILLGYVLFYTTSANAPDGLRSIKAFLPSFKMPLGASMLPIGHTRLLLVCYGQSIIKLLLTEGDRLLLSTGSSLYHQGVYAVVGNYGSLVARLLFRPLEETGRNYFAKLLGSAEVKANSKDDTDIQTPATSHTPVQGSDEAHTPSEAVVSAYHTLETMVKCLIILSLVFACIGSNFTQAFTQLVLGETWVALGTSYVLSFHFIYLLFLATNGITEAFVFAVASESTLVRLNGVMIVTTGIYVSVAWALLQHYGTVGLLWGGCLNMALRVLSSAVFIHRFFRRQNHSGSVLQLLPHPAVWFAFVTAFLVSNLAAHVVGLSPWCLAPLALSTGDRSGICTITEVVIQWLPAALSSVAVHLQSQTLVIRLAVMVASGIAGAVFVLGAVWATERPMIQRLRGWRRSSSPQTSSADAEVSKKQT